MRLLFFTDTHIRGTTPRNRKDNFYETLKNKFNEIKHICDRLDVDYILHGGDWFDRPDISPAIVKEFAVIIKSYGRPIYSVAGNHDIFGHNPQTIGRTMLGLLEGIDILKIVDIEGVVLKKGGISVKLTGKSFSYDIDDRDRFRENYIVKKSKDVDYSIHIVHGMLLAKPFYEGIQYTLIDDIKETEADITLVGHYHSGFGIKKLDSRYFANPGSLVRVSNALSEIKRKPKVLYIELGETIHLEEIELSCAPDGEEVLDRTQLESSQDRNLKLNEFYRGIENVDNYKKIDLDSLIEELASNQEVNVEVKNEAIRRISAARERLSSGEDEL